MNKNIKTFIAVIISVVVVAGFFWFGIPGMLPSADMASTGDASVQSATLLLPLTDSALAPDALYTTDAGLQIADVSVGTGADLMDGQTVAIHYVGKFSDGKQFDSSVERSEPLVFVFGAGQVIPGMDKGLAGMRVGGVRRIIIPAALAYGAAGIKGADGNYVIPPDSTLVFDVQLMNISK